MASKAEVATLADAAARKCIMASMLYYGLDLPMMEDTDYDRLSKFAAEHFDKLSPLRQWMLGGADQIKASGFQCRVTVMAADAVVTWLRARGNSARVSITRPWRLIKAIRMADIQLPGLRYLQPHEFRWH